MRIIVVASAKGGVGKSTFCTEIGKKLAVCGKKVLLVDMDIGVRSLDLLLGVAQKTVYHWGDLLSGNCTVKQAVLPVGEGLWLLPAPVDAVDFKPEDFSGMVHSFAGFDEILLDAPAGLETGFRLAVGASSECIILSLSDPVSIRAAAFAAKTVRESGVENVRLVINRFKKKGRTQVCVDDIIDSVGARLLGVIPESEDLGGLSLGEKVPFDCKGSMAFYRMARRLSGENIPLKIRNL